MLIRLHPKPREYSIGTKSTECVGIQLMPNIDVYAEMDILNRQTTTARI